MSICAREEVVSRSPTEVLVRARGKEGEEVHVEVLVERVDGVGASRVGRAREDVLELADLDDICGGRASATGSCLPSP